MNALFMQIFYLIMAYQILNFLLQKISHRFHN